MATTSSRIAAPGPFEVLWFPDQPDEIHLLTADATFTDSDGQRPGLWIAFSRNPKSANWHPAYWNRCVRALQDACQPAPELVDEHNRRLDKRGKHIADWSKAHGQG
jgi:hypothetical protein